MNLRWLLFTSALCALPLATCVVVDPFYRFDLVTIPGVNGQRPFFAYAARMAKAESVCRLRPTQIAMGGSKVEVALDPHHPGWGAEGAYNLGEAGMPLSEMKLTLKHVINTSPLKRAVIGLDFLMFNQLRENIVYHTEVIDFDPSRLVLSPNDSCLKSFWHDLNPLLGPKALAFSLRTVMEQHRPGEAKNTALAAYLLPGTEGLYFTNTGGLPAYWSLIFNSDGFRPYFPEAYRDAINGFGGHGQEDYYIRKIWRPAPEHCFEFGQTFQTLRDIILLANDHHVNLRFFIEPLHARMLLAIAYAGLWPKFEEWKRELSHYYSTDGSPIWDFFTANSITTEHVEPGEPTAWWWEPSHYKREVGDLILDRVLSCCGPVPDDFGVPLTLASIATQHDALIAYASRDPRATVGVDFSTRAALAETPSQGECQ